MKTLLKWLKEPENYIYVALMIAAIVVGINKYGFLITVGTFFVVVIIGLVLKFLFFRGR